VSSIPPTSSELKFFLAEQFGVEGANFSIAGFCGAKRQGGFHLGSGDACLDADDYSLVHTRNRAGLSRASAGFDIGLGKAKRVPLTAYLVKKGRARWRHPENGRALLYEVIGVADASLAGQPVQGGGAVVAGEVYRWAHDTDWAAQRVVPESAASHSTHTHVSFFRDMELLSRLPLFAPFFA
jgi:hypothetical protein